MAFEDDMRKGSLVHFQSKTDYPCPHCGEKLDEFQYRLYNLKLDYCAGNDHGFWLDAGEDERVIAFMRQRAGDVQRKVEAESTWRQTLKDMHSFLKKIKK
jgi:Zn-finger nucleic acid-binding protein